MLRYFFLPSLEGRGWGWVALRIVARHFSTMPRVPPEMTRRARALRSNATEAERLVWLRLRTYRPRFTRQLVVGRYILDLACREVRLAVEFDGSQHFDSSYDAERTASLESVGWRVMRFWNSEVVANPDGVAEAILIEVARACGPTHPQPLPFREGRKK
jgi:very-short-patch-repair endonuclease